MKTVFFSAVLAVLLASAAAMPAAATYLPGECPAWGDWMMHTGEGGASSIYGGPLTFNYFRIDLYAGTSYFQGNVGDWNVLSGWGSWYGTLTSAHWAGWSSYLASPTTVYAFGPTLTLNNEWLTFDVQMSEPNAHDVYFRMTGYNGDLLVDHWVGKYDNTWGENRGVSGAAPRVDPPEVPEPSLVVLLGAVFAGAALLKVRRRR